MTNEELLMVINLLKNGFGVEEEWKNQHSNHKKIKKQ